jgi:hypothetical protein
LEEQKTKDKPKDTRPRFEGQKQETPNKNPKKAVEKPKEPSEPKQDLKYCHTCGF